jgi:hypothetical protein
MPTVLRQKETVKTFQLEDGAIEEQRQPVFVYIHCYNQSCTRYHNLQSNLNFEEKVPGIREETQFTYKDRGGDAPGIENSHVRWFVRDEDDRPLSPRCEECGELMNVSGSPSYKLTQYGVGPGTGLKGAERAAALAAAKVNEAAASRDAEIDSLKVQLEHQNKMLQALLENQNKASKPAKSSG